MFFSKLYNVNKNKINYDSSMNSSSQFINLPNRSLNNHVFSFKKSWRQRFSSYLCNNCFALTSSCTSFIYFCIGLPLGFSSRSLILLLSVAGIRYVCKYVQSIFVSYLLIFFSINSSPL